MALPVCFDFLFSVDGIPSRSRRSLQVGCIPFFTVGSHLVCGLPVSQIRFPLFGMMFSSLSRSGAPDCCFLDFWTPLHWLSRPRDDCRPLLRVPLSIPPPPRIPEVSDFNRRPCFSTRIEVAAAHPVPIAVPGLFLSAPALDDVIGVLKKPDDVISASGTRFTVFFFAPLFPLADFR